MAPLAGRRTRQVGKALLQLVLDVGCTQRGDVLVHDFICRTDQGGDRRVCKPHTQEI